MLLASVGGGRGMPRPEIKREKYLYGGIYYQKTKWFLGFFIKCSYGFSVEKKYIKYKTKHISKIIISRKGLPFFKSILQSISSIPNILQV